MIEWIGLALLLITTYILNYYWIQPLRIRQKYTKVLEDLGYQVCVLPYRPFGCSLYEYHDHYLKEKGDSLYHYKHNYKGVDIVLSNITTHPYFLISNPKIAQEMVGAEKHYLFPKARQSIAILEMVFGNGMLYMEGDIWKNRRKMFTKAFNFDLLKDMVPLVAQISDDCFDRIEKQNTKENGEVEMDLNKCGTKIFSSVLFAKFIGKQILDEKVGDKEIHRAVIEISNETFMVSRQKLVLVFGLNFYKLGFFESHRKLQKKKKMVFNHLTNYIRKLKDQFDSMSEEERKKSTNLIHLMYLNAKEEKMTEKIILEELLNFINAGSDTTSNMMLFVLLRIFDHPEVYTKLMEEINKYVKDGSYFTFDNIKKLKYLDWIQYQTIRLDNSGELLFDRIAAKDTYLSNIPIKKGTIFNILLQARYNDDDVFENASEFRPERWASQNQELLNYIMMRFNVGPRTCIGKQMGLMEAKIGVVKFLHRYEGMKQLYKREIVVNFTYSPRHSVVHLKKRVRS